jgi:hypothetical protein
LKNYLKRAQVSFTRRVFKINLLISCEEIPPYLRPCSNFNIYQSSSCLRLNILLCNGRYRVGLPQTVAKSHLLLKVSTGQYTLKSGVQKCVAITYDACLLSGCALFMGRTSVIRQCYRTRFHIASDYTVLAGIYYTDDFLETVTFL